MDPEAPECKFIVIKLIDNGKQAAIDFVVDFSVGVWSFDSLNKNLTRAEPRYMLMTA